MIHVLDRSESVVLNISKIQTESNSQQLFLQSMNHNVVLNISKIQTESNSQLVAT